MDIVRTTDSTTHTQQPLRTQRLQLSLRLKALSHRETLRRVDNSSRSLGAASLPVLVSKRHQVANGRIGISLQWLQTHIRQMENLNNKK